MSRAGPGHDPGCCFSTAAHPPPAPQPRLFRQLWAGGVVVEGFICELQHEVGPGGRREEEAELERRDSNEGKGKTTPKQQTLTGRDEVHVLAECVEQQPLEAGGGGGQG